MSNKTNKVEPLLKISSLLICGLLCLVFFVLSVSSMLSTSVIDPDHFVAEHILYVRDSLFINVLVAAVVFLLLKLLKKYAKPVNTTVAAIALLTYTTILGVLWVASVRSVPAAIPA